ncbi:PqiC family protein [Desulfovibrio falkowii]|uniref:ABC-type transport auxiliary lipoprotein component domain-containing protein n=1 Tax=Desulfovibrio falkowii TaxID=3136602 RepID=A0ABQ0E883_9BACT
MQRYALYTLMAFVVLMAACSRSTPTNYYLLESRLTPVSAESLPGKNLRVAPVTVPEYLDRDGIVSRVGESTQLVVAQFHSWAEPLSHGVRRVTREVLTRPMLDNGINVLPAGDESTADYVLYLDVQRLDGNFDQKAVLDVRWTLRSKYNDVLARGIYVDEEDVAGKSYDILTAAESRMVQRMAEHLTQRLPGFTGGRQ